MIVVLVCREHGADAVEAARDRRRRRRADPVASDRNGSIEHEVVVAAEGEPGLSERDDPDRAPGGRHEARRAPTVAGGVM